MIKLWKHLLLPICEAVGATKLLEVGAEYGSSTTTLAKYVDKRDGHLHCIDPSPEFDPAVLSSQYGSRFSFHGDLSLNVLPGLTPVDVVLLDGDHNWYTVYHELQQLEELHRQHGADQPLIFIHDLGWPYGRRDLYYNPDVIPAAFRQPFARRGILPNRNELVDAGGMNADLCNAVQEGGPRNGVMTGVEDYIADSGEAWVFRHLPTYYGIGVLAPSSTVAANAALSAELDKFDLPAHTLRLLQQAEHLRCVDGIMMQAINRRLNQAEDQIRLLEAEQPAGSAVEGGLA